MIGNGEHTIYIYGDDWGMVYDIAIPTLHNFGSSETWRNLAVKDMLSWKLEILHNWWEIVQKDADPLTLWESNMAVGNPPGMEGFNRENHL